MIRLNKFLAMSLDISRRNADLLIVDNKIKINSHLAVLGQKIDSVVDEVTYLGNKIDNVIVKKYYAFYKPRGYICSHKVQGGSVTIYKLIGDKSLKFAGRLDKDSEGLLLLSNDGDWINKLTHPKYSIKKVYEVKTISEIDKNTFKLKVKMEGVIYTINDLFRIGDKEYKVTLTTGKNREIRKIFKYNDIGIESLKRVQMDVYLLNGMKPGEIMKLEVV